MVHATPVHHQHDKIGCFSTDLKTPAATGNGDWRWSTPALRRSTSSDPLAVATPEADCNIYHRRDHNDALRIGWEMKARRERWNRVSMMASKITSKRF